MTTRLDRLFLLLDSGSTAVTRRAAANQLGEVQRLHPHELHNLLRNILGYIKSSSWETRIAAGYAVEAILKKVPIWNPIGLVNEADLNGVHGSIGDPASGRLTCDNFDINTILENSAYLMGSEGTEYETPVNQVHNQESLSKQKEMLNQKLGLGAASRLGFDTDSLYSLEDLKVEVVPPPNNTVTKANISEVVGLSCREANRARRKARQALSKQLRSVDRGNSVSGGAGSDLEEEDGPDKKRAKLEPGGEGEVDSAPIPVPDITNNWPPEVEDWPLEWFYAQLTTCLFSPRWEIRHGAGTALRHLVKTHGVSGGMSGHLSSSKMSECHQDWLVDLALRLICVLTLDRFGDFILDQVVAPVRETCAQALGSVVNLMTREKVVEVFKVLLRLLEQKDWETRHGGLLGIKYMFAVRQELLRELLPLGYPGLHRLLTDPVDDVNSVAAAALDTGVDTLTSCLPEAALQTLDSLCRLVPELDDLTPASVTFVPLLAKLLLKSNISSQIKVDEAVSELVQRLWSLLEHNSQAVRKASLQTLSCLPGTFPSWSSLLQSSLRHLFQRALLEPDPAIRATVETVWTKLVDKSELRALLVAACPYMTTWLCLMMQHPKVPFDPTLIITPKTLLKDGCGKSMVGGRGGGLCPAESAALKSDLKHYIGGNETVPYRVREASIPHIRCMAARMLGYMSMYIVRPAPNMEYTSEMESPIDRYVKVLTVYLTNKSALQRFITGLVVAHWSSLDPPQPPPLHLTNRLMECLIETVYYDEIGLAYSKLVQEIKDLVSLLKHYEVPSIDQHATSPVLTLDQMEQLCGTEIPNLLSKSKLKPKTLETLLERQKALHSTIVTTLNEQNCLHTMTQAALAGGLVSLGSLPQKLTPIVKPLMESIKKEEHEELQMLSAKHLSQLVEKCLLREPSPNYRIIANLCNLLKDDPEFKPNFIQVKNFTENTSAKSHLINSSYHVYSSIVTLFNQQRNAECTLLKRSIPSGGRGPGRPSAIEVQLEVILEKEDTLQRIYHIQRRGAIFALEAIVELMGKELPRLLPNLWQSIILDLLKMVDLTVDQQNSTKEEETEATISEQLVGVLQVLEVTCSSVHLSLLPQLLSGLDHLTQLLSHRLSAVRHMASRCLAALASVDTPAVMSCLIERVLPMLSVTHDDTKRRGAAEAITVILERLQMNILPYILFLVVPLLGRMSDQLEDIRTLATHTFADLIQLMPLEGSAPDPPSLSPALLDRREHHRHFLECLFNPAKMEDYKVPVPIAANLRSYQQAGVNWLAFLNRYKLHGLLCDDMGLGKTLQSICILAGDHHDRHLKYKETGQADCAPLHSLVVCPPTLTGHWAFEVEKFVDKRYLNPLQYSGPPTERERLKEKYKKYNLIIASYDIVRKDIEFFASIKWNYCILDEGHVIKNGKTKSSQAIKQLSANHRLILSGTPIQNNVLELWSLFDFLMPGFLGSEKQFTARYSKPILASRDPKSSTKEQEAGVLAMEALHRQVLPFVLRRMKVDVLKDLPPKITQDYYCELSPLQKSLYEDFARSKAHQTLSESINSKQQANSSHIFQALRYLQSVCNHPKLALTPKHPQYERILQQLTVQGSNLYDIKHAAKLPALKQLLKDCGIGVTADEQTEGLVVNQHRALIFCQLKAMLDILENDFFKAHMPTVSYLRLDGSVPASLRHSVVTRFNNDPSIDVLILTTQVGGLGLNLTGADTVIFVEHDWSPMKDLQAMDRAHRIGQKKVVNVYRLITRSTLEEKIMGLQKFKLMTANTVISAENASLETMGTNKVLDLFSLSGGGSRGLSSGQGGSGGGSSGGSLKSMLDTLPDLWDHAVYEEEYSMDNFIQALNS